MEQLYNKLLENSDDVGNGWRKVSESFPLATYFPVLGALAKRGIYCSPFVKERHVLTDEGKQFVIKEVMTQAGLGENVQRYIDAVEGACVFVNPKAQFSIRTRSGRRVTVYVPPRMLYDCPSLPSRIR